MPPSPGIYIAILWTRYGRNMSRGYPRALDTLSDAGREVDAEPWLRVLVPFAAALLLRGRNFEARFTERVVKELDESIRPRVAASAGDARMFELQRLLAPVLATRWVLMHASPDSPVITSDTGWAPYRDALRGELGLAIPIDSNSVLGLVPARTRPAIYWNGSAWCAVIDHRKLNVGSHASLNPVFAQFAYLQVFGPTRASVEAVRDELSRPGGPVDPFRLHQCPALTGLQTNSRGIAW
jgi:hypothetical protein